MKFILKYLTICLAGILFSCSKSNNNSTPHDCSITVQSANAPTDGSVSYLADLSGSGTISKLIYRKNFNDTTILNPPIPYLIILPINSGEPIVYSGTGTTTGGTITLTYTYISKDGSTT